MNPVGWFEIPVEDMSRARAFYEGMLGIQIPEHDFNGIPMAWFPMYGAGTGASGTLVKSPNYTPSKEGTIVYFSTQDMEASLQRGETHGGKILIGKTSIGEHGFIAHLEDTEGNRIALHSRT
jgi:predicted enzyme related to lactoylglutathione lyase